ncbi:MAG: hypothetical protein ACOYL8_01040 [Patescibacteria group bacterium]
MEEIKNLEEKECCKDKGCCEEKDCCEQKSCCGDKKSLSLMNKCCPMGHKIMKIVLAVIIVLTLLCIGARFGERHSERFGNYEGRGSMMGYGSRGDFQGNSAHGGCQKMNKEFNQENGAQGGCQYSRENGPTQGICPMMEQSQVPGKVITITGATGVTGVKVISTTTPFK